jgi:hypothetical protein
LIENFLGYGPKMKVWIGRIVELPGHPCTGNGAQKIERPANRPLQAFVFRGAFHGRAKTAHTDTFFFREAFRYKENNFVAATNTDKR